MFLFLCLRSWLRFAPGISLLSLSATRRPVRAWQWVSDTHKFTQTQTRTFWQAILEHSLSLSPSSWEQACHTAVRGAGRELLGFCVRPQLGPLLPQPAPACPKTSGQPHRAAHFWQPSPRWASSRAGCHNGHHASASAAGRLCLSDYRRRAGEGCECFEGTEPSGVSGMFCVFLYAAILWLPPSKELESQRINHLCDWYLVEAASTFGGDSCQWDFLAPQFGFLKCVLCQTQPDTRGWCQIKSQSPHQS